MYLIYIYTLLFLCMRVYIYICDISFGNYFLVLLLHIYITFSGFSSPTPSSQAATPSWRCLRRPRRTQWSSGRTATDPTGKRRACGDIPEEPLSLGKSWGFDGDMMGIWWGIWYLRMNSPTRSETLSGLNKWWTNNNYSFSRISETSPTR